MHHSGQAGEQNLHQACKLNRELAPVSTGQSA
jgi:hypothetical protein